MAPRKSSPRAVQQEPEADPRAAARAAVARAISESLDGRRPSEQFVAKRFWLVLRGIIRGAEFVGGTNPTAVRAVFPDGSAEELPWKK